MNKKKGNPKRLKKSRKIIGRNITKKIMKHRDTVTRKYGQVPKKRHFCIICKLKDGVINKEDLTVHHDKKQSDGGSNRLSNIEILCEKHHSQLHNKYFHKRVKKIYRQHRKAKVNKI